MDVPKPLRCFAVFLMLAAMSGCRSSGTWNSPRWATSTWNPSTWSTVGSTPPSLASREAGPDAREPYLAKGGKPELPSSQASPTQTPAERLAAQNRVPAVAANAPDGYPATPASYNAAGDAPFPNEYPATSGGYPPTAAQPVSYGGSAVTQADGSRGVGTGTPYMAPQQDRYAVPPMSNDPLQGSGYQGGAVSSTRSGPVNSSASNAGCRYDTASDRYGISATPSPRYGNPAGAADPYSAPVTPIGDTGYAPSSTGYQPPTVSDYQPGNTGYQPGNTGYTPPGSTPYQPPQPAYQTPQSGYQSPQSGYQSPQPYQPATGNTTSTGEPWRPGGTGDYPGAPATPDSQVVPTQYIAPEAIR